MAYWGEGTQMNAPVQSNPSAGIVFRGRSNRLGGTQTTTRSTSHETSGNDSSSSSTRQQNQGDGVAFCGKSYRLNGWYCISYDVLKTMLKLDGLIG